MNAYLAVTIDVEPDCTPSWHYASPLTFEGVAIGIGERLHPLLRRCGARPTYLINNVVLEDERSVGVLKELDATCELGTHLHAEFIEPQKLHRDYAGQRGLLDQGTLEPAVEAAKLATLTRLFTERFGASPRAFRAGRFGAGAATAAALVGLGYRVDTSVTPHLLWTGPTRPRPVDYTGAPEQPYFVGAGPLTRPDPSGPLLEVPVTIGLRRRLWRRRPLWLRPVYAGRAEAAALVRRTLQRYRDERMVVLNMMFHNVEVLPGKSPYTATERDCVRYLDFLEGILQLCAEQGVRPATLSELYALYCSNRS